MDENMSFIGTIDDAIDIVPTKVLSMMASQDRRPDYIFRTTIMCGYILVW